LLFLFVLGFYFPGQCICGYWHLWQFRGGGGGGDSQHSNTSLSFQNGCSPSPALKVQAQTLSSIPEARC
jgi:hypothetical protein